MPFFHHRFVPVAIVVGVFVIGPAILTYVRRQDFLAAARVFDRSDFAAHGWLSPWVEGRYRDRLVRLTYESASREGKQIYSIIISTSVAWAFEAKQKNFLTEFRRELHSSGTPENEDNEAEQCYAFTPLAIPDQRWAECLRRPEVGDAMNGLFGKYGIEKLKLENRKLTAILVQKVRKRWTPENVEAILVRMVILARQLDELSSSDGESRNKL